MFGFFVAAFDRVYHDLIDVHLCAELFPFSDVQHDFGWIRRQRDHVEFHLYILHEINDVLEQFKAFRARRASAVA